METVFSILSYLFTAFQVAFGFGFMIFVHELGHFIMAKKAGVKVEKFFLGFDFWNLKIFSFTRGGTEYGIGVFPLGGYVKMLGQEDLPTGKLETDDLPSDHYLAKTTGQRAAIIASGVIMNFLSAFLLCIIVFYMGVDFIQPVIGNISGNSPAWKSGIRVGDRIISIDGEKIERWNDVAMGMALSSSDSNIHKVGVERDGKRLMIDVETSRHEMTGLQHAGIQPMFDLKIRGIAENGYRNQPSPSMKAGLKIGDRITKWNSEPLESWQDFISRVRTSVDKSVQLSVERDGQEITVEFVPSLKPIGMNYYGCGVYPLSTMRITGVRKGGPADIAGIREGDRLTAVDGRKIATIKQLSDILGENKTAPVSMMIERNGTTETVEVTSVYNTQTERYLIEVSLDSSPFLGPVTAVEKESPADKAGISQGDFIVKCDGKPVRTVYELKTALQTGNKHTLTLQKKSGIQIQTNIVLRDPEESGLLGRFVQRLDTLFNSRVHINDPYGTGMLFSYKYIAGYIEPGTTAAESEITKGDELFSMEYTENGESVPVTGDALTGWGAASYYFSRMIAERLSNSSQVDPKTVKLNVSVKRGDEILGPFTLHPVDMPENSEGWAGIEPAPLSFTVQPENFLDACRYGLTEPVVMLKKVFDVLHGLFISHRVSTRSLSGPLGIVTVTFLYARMGLSKLIYLLAFISVNLAVVNILPFPVLDGGHLVFLFIEKLRGKPVDIKIQEWIQTAGLVILLAFVIYVTMNDIRLITHL